MGCQKHIARTLIEAEADYLLALKENHKRLCEDVRLWLETETATGRLPVHETVDKDHGRIEIRRCSLSAQIDWLAQKPEWKGLAAMGRVESTRILGDKTTVETRYYLCSFTDWNGLPRVYGGIGRSKTSSIGYWMCSSEKMATGPEQIMRRKIWL
jgi:hypothetical protein